MSGYNTGPRVALQARYKDAAAEFTGMDLADDNVDDAYFNIPFKCKVVYAGVVVTTAVAVAAAQVKFDRRHTAGADGSSRTSGTIAHITIPLATAVGQVVYDKAAQGKLTEAAAAALVTADTCRAGGGVWRDSKCQNEPYGYLEPGMEVVAKVVETTATGKCQPILVVDMCEEVFGNLAATSETA